MGRDQIGSIDDAQSSHRAGGRTEIIGDNYVVGPDIDKLCVDSRIGGAGGATNISACKLPLIIEWRGSAGDHTERSIATDQHELVLRRSCNRRRIAATDRAIERYGIHVPAGEGEALIAAATPPELNVLVRSCGRQIENGRHKPTGVATPGLASSKRVAKRGTDY